MMMMSQSLLYLEKRQLPTAAPVFIVVFDLPGAAQIFYTNGRTIIHCTTNVKQKMNSAADLLLRSRDRQRRQRQKCWSAGIISGNYDSFSRIIFMTFYH